MGRKPRGKGRRRIVEMLLRSARITAKACANVDPQDREMANYCELQETALKELEYYEPDYDAMDYAQDAWFRAEERAYSEEFGTPRDWDHHADDELVQEQEDAFYADWAKDSQRRRLHLLERRWLRDRSKKLNR